MDAFYTSATVVLGLILRLGLPLLATALIIWELRRVDARWQAEARSEQALAVVPLTGGRPCWEVHGCSAEKRAHCRAYQNQDIPCWQQFRDGRGYLKNDCLGCDVFRLAPAPARG